MEISQKFFPLRITICAKMYYDVYSLFCWTLNLKKKYFLCNQNHARPIEWVVLNLVLSQVVPNLVVSQVVLNLVLPRLSRNTRALWYFSHMNTVIHVQNRQELAQFTGDLEVVSVMPQEPVPAEWDWDTGHLYKYEVWIHMYTVNSVHSVQCTLYDRFTQIRSDLSKARENII